MSEEKPDISDNTEHTESPEEKPKRIRRVPIKEKSSATITLEDLQNLQLSRAQFKQIRKARTDPTEKQLLHQKKASEALALARQKANEKAIEYAKNKDHIDLRKDKSVDGIVVKITPPRKRVAKPKPEPESEEEEEEEKPKFHARKPKLDDPIEQKVNKLNQLNQALSGNPFYAQIMASRGRY
jgi:hypothetical protein